MSVINPYRFAAAGGGTCTIWKDLILDPTDPDSGDGWNNIEPWTGNETFSLRLDGETGIYSAEICKVVVEIYVSGAGTAEVAIEFGSHDALDDVDYTTHGTRSDTTSVSGSTMQPYDFTWTSNPTMPVSGEIYMHIGDDDGATARYSEHDTNGGNTGSPTFLDSTTTEMYNHNGARSDNLIRAEIWTIQ